MGKGINTRHRYVTLCDHAGVGVGWAVFARTVAIAHVHRSCGHSNGMAQKRKKFRAKRLAAQTSLADRGIVIEAPTPKLSKKRLRKLQEEAAREREAAVAARKEKAKKKKKKGKPTIIV